MRPRTDEIQFGSDSFLDVLANLVGILIIMIVLAGLRVARQPRLPTMSVADQKPPATVVEPLEQPAEETASRELTDLHEPELGTPQSFPTVSIAEESLPEVEMPSPQVKPSVDSKLLKQSQAAKARAESLQQFLALARDKVESTQEQQASAEERVRITLSQMAELESLWQKLQLSMAEKDGKAEMIRTEIAAIERQLYSVDTVQTASPAKTLQHRVTPLAKMNEGNEKHFRVLRKRVVEVPLEMLIERLKDQIERKRDFIIKSHGYQGQVGPVSGFTLKYLIEQQAGTALDGLQYGSAMRLVLAGWELDAESDEMGEPLQAALKPGSRFYDNLLQAKRGTMVTFWVYPDSFKEFAALQKIAHSNGFLVAGRPLPAGIPIAGSPEGSRSLGQ